MIESLFLVGGSVRAAMQSARRAGVEAIHVADWFLDQELDVAQSRARIDWQYGDLTERLNASSATAWLYTGALENHPSSIAAAERDATALLLGNSADTLRAVRDPWQVVAALRRARLEAADVCRPDEWATHVDRRDARWLLKPRASAAGRGIHFASPVHRGADMPTADVEWYAQRWVAGTAHAAIFVGAQRKCRLIGVTRQWTGADLGLDNPFQYAGSCGPLALSEPALRTWQAIGDALTARFNLQGIFGVDAIVDAEKITPVEINPRYTASVEIIERATGWSAIRDHVLACRDGELPDALSLDQPPTKVSAKLLVFADHAGRATSAWRAAIDDEIASSPTWPPIADLPRVDTEWPAGAPIVTLFADANDVACEAVEARLLMTLRARGEAIRTAT